MRPPIKILSMALLSLGVWLHAIPVQAQQHLTLYNFGQLNDGELPYGALIADANGILYGTTSRGGVHNSGTVFALNPPAVAGGAWTETQLLSFDGEKGGSQPLAGLAFGSDGVLYGTTSAGGSDGAGVVFSLTPPAAPGGDWTETVLYNFTGDPDGSSPNYGPLLLSQSGALYGMTSEGGANGVGAAYSLTPPQIPGGAWMETVLWSFGTGMDGSYPLGGLVEGANGVLYGGASGGGAHGQGMLFSLTPLAGGAGAWTESVLYNFLGGTDGTSPVGNLTIGTLLQHPFVLYGVTAMGGGPTNEGVAYTLIPPGKPGEAWTETIMYKFSTIGTRQYNPRSGFAVSPDGTLYVTASLGGLGPYGGVIQLKPPQQAGNKWKQAFLFHFIGTNGNNPGGGLLYLNGVLYGTTYLGGEQNYGVVYSWNTL
jgi:uncharacterized repeat protein (TIGR03803 family)